MELETQLGFELNKPDLGQWRSGNTGVEGVWHFDSSQPGRAVLISSLIHGNELCGAWAVKGLLESGLRPQQGSLTLMFCNLDAFDRFDQADNNASRFADEDMNRQWSADRLADPSTLERRRIAVLRPFIERADWVLDIHSMSQPCAPLMLTGIHERNIEFALELKSPEHLVVDAGHKDGARMRDYAKFGVSDELSPNTRSLLIECGYHGDNSSVDVAKDACLRFLKRSQLFDEAVLANCLRGWGQPEPSQQTVLDVSGPVVAKSGEFKFIDGVFGLQEFPKAGTVIGDNDREAVLTPYDQCVLIMPSLRPATPGVTMVRFARKR